jgi:hypothetical protein
MRLVRTWSEDANERFWFLASVGWLLIFSFALVIALLGGFN